MVPKKKQTVEDDLPGSIFSSPDDDLQFEKFKQKDIFGLESKPSKPIALPQKKLGEKKKEEEFKVPEGVPVFPLMPEPKVQKNSPKEEPKPVDDGF